MKIMTIMGTRPDGIKMAPLILALKRQRDMETVTVITAQHRRMLDDVLDIFDLHPDYDLDIFQDGQTLTEIIERSLHGLEQVLSQEKPDIVLVHGDTSTAFSGALAAFCQRIPIGHVEAGLRSDTLHSPFPEEGNRRLTGVVSDYHFAPTLLNRANLLRENYPAERIFVTGNTVIDALLQTVRADYEFRNEKLKALDFSRGKKILLTAHRRENLGAPMESVFSAIRAVIEEREEAELIFPMHLNPAVRETAKRFLGDHPRIHLLDILDYREMCNLMAKVYFVMTDSGGLQEEAPALGKPVLVLRENTERPEALEAGTIELVGTEYDSVYASMNRLLTRSDHYERMASSVNPYGDGKASERIVQILRSILQNSLK